MNKLWAAMIVPVVGIFGAMASVYADSTLVTVNISNTSLELDVPASPTILTLNPTASGANFGYVDLTATVGTNNPTGYQLSVTFSDTSLTRTSAVGSTTPTISTLDTLAGGYPVADFTVNRWGHKITGDNYFPVPSSTLSPESWSSDEPVNNAPNVITLAAKADGSIPSGNYETTLTYTLVANVSSVTFDDAFSAASKTRDTTTNKYKMQDMNASICDMVTTPTASDYSDTPETQLVDIRDGKVYWVAKLMDGKCWMTQNLDLDLENIPTNVAPLTHANTDIGWTDNNPSATWTPEHSTVVFDASTTTSASGWNTDYYAPYSADPGAQYVVTSGTTSDDSVYYTLADCMAHASTGTEDECRHYHTGNYYNWTAAIAENDSEAFEYPRQDLGFIAPNSICPAGWRIPVGKSSSTYTYSTTEYAQLMFSQGVTTDISGPSIADGYKIVRRAPLFFVRGGGVGSGGSIALNDLGSYGIYWSSTIDIIGFSNVFHISSGIDSTGMAGRNCGLSLRCVAR